VVVRRLWDRVAALHSSDPRKSSTRLEARHAEKKVRLVAPVPLVGKDRGGARRPRRGRQTARGGGTAASWPTCVAVSLATRCHGPRYTAPAGRGIVPAVRLRPVALLVLGACQAPTSDSSAFTTTPVTTVPDGSSSGSSSSSSSSGTTTTDDSGSGGGSADSTTEPVRDLGGTPDFGDGKPAGCKGKIDLLFVIMRGPTMVERQAQLALAVPQFIDAIKLKFDDFDYHIMVVDGDGETNNNGEGWGSPTCDHVCPNLACKIGQPCCPGGSLPDAGKPCCGDPNYPCEDLDLVTACDWTWGAGTVFPAGEFTADKPCPIDGGRRYLVKGQTDLEETFACIVNVGTDGWKSLGQALTAAMQKPINGPGGCNDGFLREDALLMVTTIATNPDTPELGSEGTPAEWAQAVIDAKGGDEESVVMYNIGGPGPECKPYDRVCQMAAMFTYHHLVYAEEPDYGPGFGEAASLVETACAGFTPPG
jgi:hypothetical protein